MSVYVRICMYVCMFLSSDTCCVCSHMICSYIIIFVKLFAGNIFVYIIYIICRHMLFMLYVFRDCGICCMCVRTCVIICINSNNMKAFVLISIESQRNKRKHRVYTVRVCVYICIVSIQCVCVCIYTCVHLASLYKTKQMKHTHKHHT